MKDLGIVLKLDYLSFKMQERTLLDQVSVTVKERDFIILQGANGSGKSSLMDLITGCKTPYQGHIWLSGYLATDWSEFRRSSFISRMSQNTMQGCFPSLTVEENLTLASLKRQKASLRKGKSCFDKERLSAQLSCVGIDLEPLLHRPMGVLSGGQRQLLTFLMATLVDPCLLLLDEPTAALDTESAEKLIYLATQLVKEKNIATIMITHDQQLAKRIGNKYWHLHQGKINERTKDYSSEV